MSVMYTTNKWGILELDEGCELRWLLPLRAMCSSFSFSCCGACGSAAWRCPVYCVLRAVDIQGASAFRLVTPKSLNRPIGLSLCEHSSCIRAVAGSLCHAY